MSKLRGALTYANVVSTLALFVVLGGSAYAATKLPRNSVGSAQIKKNAVTSSKVKNKSLTAGDFKPGQLPRGAQGPPGPAGANGTKGQDGARGPSDGVFASSPSQQIGNADTPLATVTLTPGKWLLFAETRLEQQDGGGGQDLDCRIFVTGVATPLDQLTLPLGNSGTLDAFEAISLTGAHTATSTTTATFACDGEFSSTKAEQPSLSGLKVATLNGN